MAKRRLPLALLFLSLALSLLAASELAGPANAVTSNANQPKISSTSDNSVYQSSYQNPGFYAQGRYWVFYEDSASQCEHQNGCLLYVSSTNGASQWSLPSNVGVHVTDNDWSVTTDGTNAYYVRYNETSFDHTPNQALLFGKGLLSSNGMISWQTEQVVLGPSPGTTFPNDVIGIDSNGQFWIGYQQDSSGTKTPHITHSNSTLPPAPLSTSFIANVSDPVVLQTIGFTATASGGNWGGGSGYSFNWNFGDGSVTTGQSVTHQYVNPGNFNVTLSTIDGSSPQQSVSSMLTIPVGAVLPSNNTPPSISVPASMSVKVGTSLSFTITPSDTDGDQVTLSSNSLPPGASLNIQTGKFGWTPDPDQANRFWSMTFIATDNASLSIMKQVLVYVSPSWSGDFALSNSVPNGNWHVDIATLALGSQVYAGYWVEGHNLLGRLYNGTGWGFEEDISSSFLPDTTSADVNSFIFASGTSVYAIYYDTNTEKLNWASRGSLGGWGQNIIGQGEAKSANNLGRYSLPFTAATNRVNATTSWFYVFWYNQTRRAIDEWSGTGQTWYQIATPTAFYPQSSVAGSTIASFHYSAPVNGQNNFGIIWTDGTSSPYNLNFGLETVGPTNAPPTDASWNPRVSCTASVVTIEQILGTQSTPQGGATQTGSIFSPGITAPVVNGEPKRWLTPGPTPPNWLSNGPQCNITNADGQVISTFVEIRGVQRGYVLNEDYSPNLHYDPVNGGGPYPTGTNSSDSTFNIFTPGYGICNSTNTTGCMHTIHIEIDRDWKTAGYCGTGTVCDVYPLAVGPVSSVLNKTLIDVQGFIYWDPDHTVDAAHSFSGWEIHPVTAWRKSNVAPTIGVSANPSTLTLLPGKSLTSTIVINSTNLFSGQVSLTAVVNPSGAASPTVAFSPSTVTVQPCNACAFAASTLNVTATQSSSGPYTITITATSGALTAQAKLSVFVGGFSLSATPSTLNIPTSSSAQSIITITSLGGFNGVVNLADTVSGCACGQLTNFNATQVTLSSNGNAHVAFTITTSSKTGTDIFTITGTSNTSPPFSASTLVSLNIQEFTVSTGQTVLTMYPGSPNSTVIKLSSQNGFAGQVTVKATSSPTGLSLSLNTTSVTLTSGGTAFVALTVNGTQPGIYSVTVNATSGSITRLITITVKVVDFTLSSSSSLQVDRSSTGTLTINLTSVGGFVGTVSLSNTTSSSSLHDSLNPLNISLASGGSGSTILTVFSNTATNATITITATSGPLRHSVTITVNVVDFQLVAGPVAPATINAGSHGNATITATGLNGFTGTVALTISAPSALTCSLSPASLKLPPSPIASILSCSSSTAGDYTVTVTGTDGTVSRTTGSILFHIVDFTITPSSPSLTLVVGQSTQDPVTLTPGNGFVGTVSINLVVSPVGPTATSSRTSVKLTSGGNSTVLTINAGQSTGIFMLNVTGTSGSLTHSVIISLIITADAPSLKTSLSSSNIVVGNSAFDSASLNGATTTASGTVTYLLYSNGVCNSPSTIVSVVAVSNGVIPNSRPVTFNATGTYSFNATYSGDTNNNGAASQTCELLTVNPISTTTSVACGASITIGVPTQCTVTVSDVAPGAVPPGGAVNFSTNSTGTFSPTSCTLTGSSSSTSCSVNYTPTAGGSHNITATYPADNTHTGSSGSRLLSAGQHPTTTSINCTSPVVVNQAATCTATVTDTTPTGATTPTGTVTFSETTGVTGSFNATSCILRTANTPTATCSVSFTPSASGSAGAGINGGYGGDITHSLSSGSNSITVNPRSTSTSLVCTTPVVVNQDSTCTATVSDTSSAGTAITPAGTVAFAETGVAGSFTTNTCTLSGSGATASCTSIFRDSTASGTASISGSYTSSNTVHSNSAISTATVITVNSRTTSTVVSCTSPVVVGQTSTCTATVIDTSSAGTPLTPTGTVSFSTTAGSLTGSPCSLTAGSVTGNASCTVNLASSAPATANISASYTPSDTSHSTSQTISPATVTVNKRSTTTTVSCATVNVGQSSTCTVTVTDASPGTSNTPNGAVSVTTSGGSVTPASASCSLSSGSCSVIFTPQSSGAVTVNATYIGGDSIHNGSSGITIITPGLQGTSTVLNCATPIVVNQGSSCTATVSSTATSGSTTPTGTINFSTSGSLSPSSLSCTLSSGSCTLTFTGTAQGTAIVTGNYTGDNAHSTSKNTASIVINFRSSSAILSCTATSVAVSASDSCTAYVKDKAVGTAVPPSGVISFELDGSTSGFTNCTLSTLNATTADCSIGYVPAGGTEGPHTIAATYPGDQAHLGADSNTIAVNVTQRTTGTTVNCTPSTLSLGQSTTCTATVRDTSSGTLITPTGSVTISAAPTSSGGFTGNCSLSQSTLGTATCNINYTPSTAGSQTVTGSYSGDQDHSVGNPGSFNLSVSTQTTTTAIGCTPTSIVVNTNASCNATVKVSQPAPSSTTPTGTLSFALDSSPAAFASCQLTPVNSTSSSCSVGFTPSPGTEGSHNIVSTYTPDSSHGASSGSFTIGVVQRASATSIVCTSSSLSVNSNDPCTATVRDTSLGNPIIPSGGISFYLDGSTTSLGGCSSLTTVNSTSATCAFTFTPLPGSEGSHSIVAKYSGDTDHVQSGSPSFSVAVTARTTTTSLVCNPSSVSIGQTTNCT
ncbi:Ig-like domain repeat protein, partial [Candidatus Bathyarchaeota archaeon]|nr:Ig-like domain repeat protein [Candidatus Bathyarchaeota archaeon]